MGINKNQNQYDLDLDSTTVNFFLNRDSYAEARRGRMLLSPLKGYSGMSRGIVSFPTEGKPKIKGGLQPPEPPPFLRL